MKGEFLFYDDNVEPEYEVKQEGSHLRLRKERFYRYHCSYAQ